MIRCTAAHVDLDATRENFRVLADYLAREAALNARAGKGATTAPGIIAVVKANAYGHGAVRVARALEDAEHLRASITRNIDDRQEFLNQATARMLRQDSVTNFVMLDTGRGAAGVVEHFQKHGILVSGGIRGFDRHIRVSLGTPAEMREFWRVWDLVIAHKM